MMDKFKYGVIVVGFISFIIVGLTPVGLYLSDKSSNIKCINGYLWEEQVRVLPTGIYVRTANMCVDVNDK